MKLLSGYDDNRHFRPGLMNEPHGLEPIQPRHENIDDEQIEPLGLKQPQAGLTVVDSLDGMRGALKQ